MDQISAPAEVSTAELVADSLIRRIMRRLIAGRTKLEIVQLMPVRPGFRRFRTDAERLPNLLTPERERISIDQVF